MGNSARASVARRSLVLSVITACGLVRQVGGAQVLASAKQVMVVRTPRVPAYEEAFEGVQLALTSDSFGVISAEVDASGSTTPLSAALLRNPVAVVALGTQSTGAAAALDTSLPLVATMVMSAPTTRTKRPVTTVSLELAPTPVLTKLRDVYPGRTRLTIVRGPSMATATLRSLEAAARTEGFTVASVDCSTPKLLLETINGLSGKTDWLWCLPDAALYPSAAVPTIVMASMRCRVPLIGFSEGFVRAGALVGFYADYHDVGRQAGESAIRLAAGGQLGPIQPARKIRIAVNERILRLLGISHKAVEGLVVLK